MKQSAFLKLIIILLIPIFVFGQQGKKQKQQADTPKKETTEKFNFSGLKWRSIGPAFMSGRISDLAVNPKNQSEYYVGVASGNVWKTTNNGTTFEPIFDKYGAYAIGCLTLDPNNPFVLWVGTGENNHQRALGYGDGVYKSIDGGKSFKNMGLKDSRQIGKIIVDPRNSNIVFVAAEGSVWGPGGDRGLYKTIDGGKTWKKTLNISENTGVNNIVYDPRNPDVMYATSEQRRRHVHTKIGGGPESAVYKSYDAGETWEKIMSGLPSVDIGGMGMDISPVNPDVLYIIMEAAESSGGFFRSTNRGATWEKMSAHTEAGQYYNEIYCDPKNVDKVYSVETVSKFTSDAGKTWTVIGNNNRHVDDHVIWINPNDTKHIMIGGDGGLYESFDEGKNYIFKTNLPVTQFYRVAVDNTLPFYYVYGGTQDNNSQGGPSRTIKAAGIYSSDWFITNGGDGFWSAIDPENPNIVYAESQYGGMVRYDKQSGESISIRPEPRKGELTYKWNWNAPLFISPHKNTRIYTAANKVFRSDNRGDSWDVISDDLTAQLDRNTWPVMGKFWSVDAVSKDRSTSLYGEIISMTESPVKENLLYVGTDDGLIQVSEDAKTWRKVSEFPGIPANTYVSDICASKFDENVVFASFDNILRDDFKPYIMKSSDKGKTWISISNNLPEAGTIHTIEQDYIDPELLFVGTEFGFYYSKDGGANWNALKNGLPTIAVRDIAIQKREGDLVIATFGRGFYIIDDYSPLRAPKNVFEKTAHIFPIKDALMFIPNRNEADEGSMQFKAPNPEYGAVFSYFIKDVPKTLKAIRKEKEKELFKEGKPIPAPTVDALRAEQEEVAPYLIFTITDESGNVARTLTTTAGKGTQRINWDLRYQAFAPVSITDKFNPVQSAAGGRRANGNLALPGKYKVSLSMVTREGISELAAPVEFNAIALRNTTLPAADRAELTAFQKKASQLAQTIQATQRFLAEMIARVENIKAAIGSSTQGSFELLKKAEKISSALEEIRLKFSRPSTAPSAEENPPAPATINDRLGDMTSTHYSSTSNLTALETRSYDILMEEFPPILEQLKKIYNEDIKAIEGDLEKINAPWSTGRIPELKK